MFEGAVVVDVFDSRIRDTAVVFEKRRQVAASYVAGLVDRGGQYGATEFTVVDRIVCAAAEERDS